MTLYDVEVGQKYVLCFAEDGTTVPVTIVSTEDELLVEDKRLIPWRISRHVRHEIRGKLIIFEKLF